MDALDLHTNGVHTECTFPTKKRAGGAGRFPPTTSDRAASEGTEMGTTTVTAEYVAIDTELIEMNYDLGAMTFPHWSMTETIRADLLAGVRGTLMHLRYGRIERAAAIVEGMRPDLAYLKTFAAGEYA